MKLTELTEFLIKSIVKEPDAVSIKGFDTEDGYIVEVLVSESDMGAVIGKGGKVANSIRTIVSASAYVHGKHNVKINIDSM